MTTYDLSWFCVLTVIGWLVQTWNFLEGCNKTASRAPPIANANSNEFHEVCIIKSYVQGKKAKDRSFKYGTLPNFLFLFFSLSLNPNSEAYEMLSIKLPTLVLCCIIHQFAFKYNSNYWLYSDKNLIYEYSIWSPNMTTSLSSLYTHLRALQQEEESNSSPFDSWLTLLIYLTCVIRQKWCSGDPLQLLNAFLRTRRGVTPSGNPASLPWEAQ